MDTFSKSYKNNSKEKTRISKKHYRNYEGEFEEKRYSLK